MRTVDEHLVSMTNTSQSTPNACSLPLPPPAYHGLGGDGPVMSPQPDAAPPLPSRYLPGDHRNGCVSITMECSIGASVTPTLPEAGMRPEEWLKPTLKEAEEALDKARMIGEPYTMGVFLQILINTQ